MDFSSFQDKTIQASTYISLDLDFYCKFSIEKVAEKFGTILKETVEVVDEDNFKPSSGRFYIIRSYGFGKERYRFYTDKLTYSRARIILISAFGVIKEFGYTDSSCICNVDISLDPNISGLNIKNLGILKFILEFNEDVPFRLFPSQKNSIYVKSIKSITPQNKFYRSDNVNINDFNYILPVLSYFGVIFDDVKDGTINFRYIGGEKYEYKIVEALNLIGFYIGQLVKVLHNPTYTDSNKKTLNKIIKQSDKLLDAYESPEKFKETYPDIKLTVDLDTNDQIVKSKYVKFRDDIFDLLSGSDITKGEINYDSELSKIQGKGFKGHVYEIDKWEFLECDLEIELASYCNFFECSLSNSTITRSNIYRFSKVKKSKIRDTYINRTCEITDTFVNGDQSTIDCSVVRGKIIGGRIGNHAKISNETEKLDYSKVYMK
jgi:hypothetical protein